MRKEMESTDEFRQLDKTIGADGKARSTTPKKPTQPPTLITMLDSDRRIESKPRSLLYGITLIEFFIGLRQVNDPLDQADYSGYDCTEPAGQQRN